ncbi:CotD family spore coat protein [Halobacillus sp. B29]|uniref:CotD family spore coat protein n=1 Tax=Halobacillus sp. B29 TaxID=3457432 RepID=UPI003FCE3D7D
MHQHSMQGQGAQSCNRRPIVCPVQQCVVDNFFVENQDYIHPTHILVQNHHLLNNFHYFPYMTSEANSFQTQDYAFPQGSSPDYNWMDYMSQNQMGQGQMPMMPQDQMGMGQGQMGMMPQDQMGQGQGQMPMMPQDQMGMGQGQMSMMPQGQMGMGQGQMQMMPQGPMGPME